MSQGSILFNIFISDLHTEAECILNKFTDDSKLGGAVDALEGWESLQRGLSSWSHQQQREVLQRKSWTWDRVMPATGTVWAMNGWRATQQKGIWGCWVTADSAWARKCIQVAKRENYTLGYIKHSTSSQCTFSICATSPWTLHAVWVLMM